ncbi:geranylgeranylglycerol-phosphate geranylgeranyltransferase [Danxiaibacter flavus]|uniref:Geranylgeranylglycerol-phosphate geranylgeranyltransferase n=1 Tax=Danxiaibacter flavus TaxID=3049108 RepID=A0ABV3ZCZ9_9BACT|nr:geranylgeranylglycerol-phosphate geranylgeranyltransferase [Chitinophagaceae bacterium DXS]
MKLVSAFFRLVRWPNLVFIALTQVLFLYCVILPAFNKADLVPNIYGWRFFLLCASSVLIAAAGYIINDYFDLDIDQVNKPDKLVVEKIIKRRWTIIWHLVLSIAGIAMGFVIDFTSRAYLLGFANILCVILLFIYSISFKKKFLIGNVLISLLTAWVILVITWAENSHILGFDSNDQLNVNKIIRVTFLYSGFAFIISLIREVIKDMEDIEGDRRYGCKTMPIMWGVNATKVFVAVWLIVLVAALLIVQIYALRLGWWISVIYCILLTVAPLLWILKKLYTAVSSEDYHKLSSLIKLVMFTGILSMIFFRIYS